LYLLKRFVLFIHKRYIFRKYCWIFASFSRYYSSTSPWDDRFGLRSTRNTLGIISSLLFVEQGYFGRHDGSSPFRSRLKIKKSKFVLLIEHYFWYWITIGSKCENNKITVRVKVSIFTKNLHYFRRNEKN